MANAAATTRVSIVITRETKGARSKALRLRGSGNETIQSMGSVQGDQEGSNGMVLRSGMDYLMELEELVSRETACSLPGVNIKFSVFMDCMRRAQSRGYVKDADAQFVEQGLRYGFEAGVARHKLKGKRVFRNYPPAEECRSQVTAAITARVNKGRTVKLGPWRTVVAQLEAMGVKDYFKFPMGAVAKASDASVKRPTSDHTRTGLNAATEMERLRHSLNTYQEVAWLLRQNYFMYVSDVEDAFLLIPLAPWLWFFLC